MIAREWPNKLGYDVGSTEVFKRDGYLGVRVFRDGDPWKVGKVVSTSDPVEAAKIVRRTGILYSVIDNMEVSERNWLYETRLF